MLRSIILNVTIILSFVNISQAQEATFGDINIEDVKMTFHPSFPEAEAVYLINNGRFYKENRVFQTPKSVYEFHQRIKIQKKSGYNYANISIPFISGTLKIAELKAVCYNWENGKVVETKVNEEDIIKETLSKNFKVQKLTFSSVKEGSIVEVFYKWTTLEVSSIPDWQFQYKIPTIWSSFSIKRQGAQTGREFDARIQGVVPMFKQVEERYAIKGDSIFENIWIQHNIPAFVPEPLAGIDADFISKIEFKPVQHWIAGILSLNTGWTFNNFIIERHDGLIAETRKANGQKKELKDKAISIYDYLGKRASIDKSIKSLYATQDMKDLLTYKKVSENELNVLYINMLRLSGLSALPALISTYEHGKTDKDYVYKRQFDKVVAYIQLPDSSKWFIDAAAYPQPFGLLPFKDLNGEAYILKEDMSHVWQNIENKAATRNYISANIVINTEGVLKGVINATYTGYDAYKNRENLKNQKPNELAQSLLKDLISQGQLDSVIFEHPDSFQFPNLKTSFFVQNSGYISNNNNKIYIQPLLCFALSENPFVGDIRLFDIDLRLEKEEITIINLTIPNGYNIEEVPKSSRIALEDNGISYSYGVDVLNNNIKITSRFKIKRTNYKATEFNALKKQYARMIEKMSEQIVLSKN